MISAWKSFERRDKMPSKTFMNLSEEKKEHLLECAKQEFTKHTLIDASINKIIQDAGISRGSFYQYFADKQDLYFCVFDKTKQVIIEGINNQTEQETDLSNAFLKIYDFLYHYIVDSNSEEYYKNVMITLHKSEIKPDNLFFDGRVLEDLKRRCHVETPAKLELLNIMIFTITKFVIDSLKEKENQKEIRSKLKQLLEIYKNGYLKEEKYEKSI